MRYLFLLLAFLSFAVISSACTCAEKTFEQALHESTSVFSGPVTGVQITNGSEVVVQFEKITMWKGVAATKIYIRTNAGEENCGYTFENGKSYLVYAAGDIKSLTVSRCSRTKTIENSAEDLERLQQLNSRTFSGSGVPRDPFSEMTGDKPSRPGARKGIPRTLSVRFAVITGITKKGNDYLALIRGSDGKVHLMRTGEPLADGWILSIDGQGVTFGQRAGSRTIRIRKTLHPFPQYPD